MSEEDQRIVFDICADNGVAFSFVMAIIGEENFHSCGFCVVVTSDKFDKQNIPFSEFGKTIFLNKPEDEQKGQEIERMKKVKIELPIRTYSGKIASVILYADIDVNLVGENTVKAILPPKITVVGESEAAAGEET